jgi:hypothetical protein
MIHIVFNERDVEVISKAIELDKSLSGEIVVIHDDYAVGPLENIFTPEGAELRKQWWQSVLVGGDFDNLIQEGKVDDAKVVLDLKGKLDANQDEVLWIWAAQNKHDVSGYFWLMSQFSAYQGRVFILYLNNLPFINEKGNIFYPGWLSQIPPREFIKAKKLARLITSSEFEVDPDDWNKICMEGKLVRLLEGGKKLTQKEADYYDADLIRFITNDNQKASKIIHQFLTKNKETTGDAFLLWRLKSIVEDEGFEVHGELKGMKDFEIKKRSAVQASE